MILAIVAVLGFIGMYLLVPFIHEIAHATVCEASRGQATIHFDGPQARAVNCIGISNNQDLYHAAGGLTGIVVSTAIAFATKNKLAFVIAFPFVVQQVLIAGLETLAYPWYIGNSVQLEPVTSLLVLGLFVLLGVRYVVTKSKKASNPRNNDIK